jgi:hypothetical protein
VKVLTVRQPWASATIAGCKDVDNRTWRFPLSLGSTIAIHAGLRTDPVQLPAPCDLPAELPHGCIIGLVDVVDCFEPVDQVGANPWAEQGLGIGCWPTRVRSSRSSARADWGSSARRPPSRAYSSDSVPRSEQSRVSRRH